MSTWHCKQSVTILILEEFPSLSNVALNVKNLLVLASVSGSLPCLRYDPFADWPLKVYWVSHAQPVVETISSSGL